MNNKKMLIPVIVGVLLITVIIIIVLILGTSQNGEKENSLNVAVENETTNTILENNIEDTNTIMINMTPQEVAIYNSTVNMYIGTNKKGVDVKALIAAIIASNTANANIPGKFISLDVAALNSSLAKIGESVSVNNTTEYVTETTNKMNQANELIDIEKEYNVIATYTTEGLISTIKLEYAGQWAGDNLVVAPVEPNVSEGDVDTSIVREKVQVAISLVITRYYQAKQEIESTAHIPTELAQAVYKDLTTGTGIKDSIGLEYVISYPTIEGTTVTFTVTYKNAAYTVIFDGNTQSVTASPAENNAIANESEKNEIKDELQTAMNTVISTYHQAQSLTGAEESARTLVAYVKNEVDLPTGILKQGLPQNYVISNGVVSGNAITFTLTIDGKAYTVTFNGVSREITIE